MNNLHTVESLKNLIRSEGSVSKHIKRLRDLIIYNINLDEYCEKDQTALYFFNQVAKAFKLIEKSKDLDVETSMAAGFKALALLEDIIKGEGKISDIFRKIHYLVIYHIKMDLYTEKHRSALSCIGNVSEALESFENTILPFENEQLNKLQKLLNEKENKITELEIQIYGRRK